MIERLIHDGFAFDVEVYHLVERYHLSLAEVPVPFAGAAQLTATIVGDDVAIDDAALSETSRKLTICRSPAASTRLCDRALGG